MCGIIGQVGDGVVGRLPLEILHHRGPDAQGCWTNSRDCILGHTRLSILDLNPRANQPMTDPSGRYTLVYNGEIYNYRQLATDYLSGQTLQTTCDTEVLLLLWAKMGPDCLPLLRGMFAFAIWDNKAHKLFLTRDRMGQKPLVYHLEGQKLTFASELNALAACLPDLSIAPAAIDLFLALQFIPAPHTIYRNVSKLPPAHYAVWDGRDLNLHRYWQLQYDESKPISESDAMTALEASLSEATQLRLRADVPVGVLLSGGVDSSLVAVLAAQQADQPIQTFSIGFEEEQYSEISYADQVAEICQSKHHREIISASHVEDYLFHSIKQYGEPFADSSSLPTLMICDTAARHLKVVLTGDGGDEAFAGYRTFDLSWFARYLGSSSRAFFHLATWLDSLRCKNDLDSFLANRLKKLRHTLSPLHRAFPTESNVNVPLRKQLYQPGLLRETESIRQKYEQILLDETQKHLSSLNQVLSLHNRCTFPNDFLVKVDIASMAFSLEARSPFLDHKLIELAATLPPHFKMRRGTGKYILKKLAEKHLPKELLYRKKRGFGLPVRDWMRTKYAGHIQEMISQSNHPLWDYLKKNTVTTWLDQHVSGRLNHGQRLWDLLILGHWLAR